MDDIEELFEQHGSLVRGRSISQKDFEEEAADYIVAFITSSQGADAAKIRVKAEGCAALIGALGRNVKWSEEN